MSLSLRWQSLILPLFLFLAGCNTSSLPAGAKPTKPVTVTLTYKGAPLEGATITFIDEASEPTPSYGLTDAQGIAKMKTSYAEGSVVGKHVVTINKSTTEGGQQASQDSPSYNPDPAPSVVKDLIPAKYGSKVTSGLDATVTESGPNEFKFDLTD